MAATAVLESAAPATPEPPVNLSAPIVTMPPIKVTITPSKIPEAPSTKICLKFILHPKAKPITMIESFIPSFKIFLIARKMLTSIIPTN